MLIKSMRTPSPIALATRVPNTAKATKLKKAAHTTATPGESTRVDTTVAMESEGKKSEVAVSEF